MFNFRPEDLFPWLRLAPASDEGVPGFNLNPDGSAGDTRRSAASQAFEFNPSASASSTIGTGPQDAMRVAPTSIYPTSYLPNGLPDFAPLPRHPLQSALNEIMRIYAGFDPHGSNSIVEEGGDAKILPTNWLAATSAPQSLAQNDDPVMPEGAREAASNSRPYLELTGPLTALDSPDERGVTSWPLPSLPDRESSSASTIPPRANREPIPVAVTGDGRPKPPIDGVSDAEAIGTETEMAPPGVMMPQPNAPVVDPNFVLANAGNSHQPQVEQTTPTSQNPRSSTGRPQEAPEQRPERTLSQSIEDYRRATAARIGELQRAVSTFGNRLYEDSILRARDDVTRLVERFADDPIGATLSVLNSFPQTRVEGEFAASFAAVWTILANAARGLKFEGDVFEALNAAQQAARINKNTTKISVEGVGRSVPDVLHQGIREIKDVVEIDSSVQLRVQAAYARAFGMPFSLIVSPNTKRISNNVRELVRQTGGTIQRFDPATGTFTTLQ